MLRTNVLACALGLVITSAAVAAEPKADETPADIAAYKSKLVVLHDGKGHYVAVVPFEVSDAHLFYGDGKKFFAQMTIGGSRSGDEEWGLTFWEPRVDSLWKSSINAKAKKVEVQCGNRATEFKPLDAAEQEKLMGTAAFFTTLWKHRAHALARDNKGTYYFVDRLREPENNRSFRLFAGPRGNLKALKMTNVVSDSQGDIFSTKKGELRLVLDRKKPTWHAGKKDVELIHLPLDDNRLMIYTDLGVYTGQRLGTPCDDLL